MMVIHHIANIPTKINIVGLDNSLSKTSRNAYNRKSEKVTNKSKWKHIVKANGSAFLTNMN